MIFRVIIALGGLTFVASGIAISMSEGCRSVIWGDGGSERAGRFSATCIEIADAGMSPAVAATLAIALGMAIILLALVPLLRRQQVRS